MGMRLRWPGACTHPHISTRQVTCRTGTLGAELNDCDLILQKNYIIRRTQVSQLFMNAI